jgi:hypothetical protein
MTTRPRIPFLLLLVLALKACSKDAGNGVDSRAQLIDYQRKADAMEWRWSKERASRKYCIDEHLKDYETKILKGEWDDTIQILAEGKEVVSFKGHSWTVFTRLADTLYVADFGPISSGCSLFAYDLTNRKGMWRSKLQGIGPTSHSKYGNMINIEMDEGAILVFGNEVHGRYIEYVDPESGRTIGHKKLPRISPWPGDRD